MKYGTYAKVTKSSPKKVAREGNSNHSPVKPINSDNVPITNCNVTRPGTPRCQDDGNTKDSRPNTNQDHQSSGKESPSSDLNELSFYNFLNRLKRFAKKSPTMSYDYWVSITIDLFEFVANYIDNLE